MAAEIARRPRMSLIRWLASMRPRRMAAEIVTCGACRRTHICRASMRPRRMAAEITLVHERVRAAEPAGLQ